MQAHSVDTHLEPEIHHLENLSQHRRVVVVEIRLVMAEPVPEVRVRFREPRAVPEL